MRQILTSLSFLLCLIVNAAADKGENDNIVINRRITTYTLKSSAYAKLGSVKERDEITFAAQRVDGNAIAMTFYNDNITVDKASASGAKPQYRKATDKDIFFDDSRVCFMQVPVKAGKEAKASFELTHSDPAQFCEIHFPSAYFTRELVVEVEVPIELASYISIEPFNLTDNMKFESVPTKDEGMLYRVTMTDVAATKREPLAPSYSLTAPRLMVKGTFYDLKALYEFLHGYCPQNERPAEAVAAMAATVSASAPTQIAAIDSVARWVRSNIRYVAIEHGDYGRSPAPAEEVLEKRYGDCKGSANLIKDMLRSIGVDARLAWIGTAGDKAYSWSEYPLMSCGNHMIAAAMLPDTVIFIDGTTGLQPDGFISPSIQGREAMIEDGASYILKHTPILPFNASTDSAAIIYAIGAQGLECIATRTLTGTFSSMIENSHHAVRSTRKNELLAAFASDQGSASADSVTLISGGIDGKPSVLTYRITDPASVKNASIAMYVGMPAFHSLPVTPLSSKELKERTRGVRLPYGWKVSTVSTLMLPEDAGEISLPDDTEYEGRWFKASISYSIIEGGAVKCVASAEVIRPDADPAETPDWNDELSKLTKLSSRKIKISKK